MIKFFEEYSCKTASSGWRLSFKDRIDWSWTLAMYECFRRTKLLNQLLCSIRKRWLCDFLSIKSWPLVVDHNGSTYTVESKQTTALLLQYCNWNRGTVLCQLHLKCYVGYNKISHFNITKVNKTSNWIDLTVRYKFPNLCKALQLTIALFCKCNFKCMHITNNRKSI